MTHLNPPGQLKVYGTWYMASKRRKIDDNQFQITSFFTQATSLSVCESFITIIIIAFVYTRQ